MTKFLKQHSPYTHTYIYTYIHTYIHTYINTKHEANSRVDRTRENEGIPPPVQTKGRREMYMRPQQSNHGSSTISLR